ncbi:DUF5134 domain-containing protein [Streptacidiphilus carbonis]|uniref:DUF5134 domain-containing protein n=1 Tax=Streptacidiphilus carbonis TaxID=105422 RepID=UPI0005A9140D|nr:DUF5134 domain-containing protein [Streptacidiphilus carbonis]
MHGPAAVGWLLTGLMGATGLYCLVRLVRRTASRAERELDASEALKGLGMAAMALPLGTGRQVPPAVWVVLFGLAALWSLGAGLLPMTGSGTSSGHPPGHRGHHLYHGVGHLAMVYMALVMGTGAGTTGAGAAMPGMAGMADQAAGTGGSPAVTGALLVFFGGYAVLAGARMIAVPVPAGGGTGTARRGSVANRLLGAPELPQACRMVLGLGMFTMLLAM